MKSLSFGGIPQTVAFLGLVLATAPTFAQAPGSASTEIKIQGTADAICTLSTPSGEGENAAFRDGTIEIGTLLNQTDATTLPSRMVLKFPRVLCNTKANLSVKSLNQGLAPVNQIVEVTSGSAPFLSKVDYIIDGSWGDVDVALDTAQSNLAEVVAPGANDADLTLTIRTEQGTVPVREGLYQDTITVSLTASP